MKNLLFLLPALATGALAAIVKGVFQTVPRGHQATKTRNGAPVKIKKPRLYWWRRKNFDETTIGQIRIYHPGRPVFKIPVIEEVLVRRVNGQNLSIQTKVVLQDFTVYLIDSYLRFITSDIEKYTYDNEHPRIALRNKAEELLLRELAGCTYSDMHGIHEIADRVGRQLSTFASQLGIELEDFGVKTYDPSPSSERMIQMNNQARMSVTALESAARQLGFDSARTMGAAMGSVVLGTALNSISMADATSKLAEEAEDASELLAENDSLNGNGKVVAIHP